MPDGLAVRRLGRTGHRSSVAVLGGAAFWEADRATAGAGLAMALERGVNHLDIAPQYGQAELVVGPHVPAVRDRLFIGCKTLRHHPDGVRDQLEESLRRLGTDHVELYQLHAVTTVDELDAREAALAEILRARDRGLCRWVGITGHDLTVPATHLEALRRHDLDTVMFPLNARLWAEPAYRAAAEELLAECARRDVGVMAIKAAARRPWTTPGPPSPWYEPWHDPDALHDAVRFTLSVPGVHAFCTPGDAALLPAVLDAAARAGGEPPLSPAELDDAAAARAADELIFPLAEKRRPAV